MRKIIISESKKDEIRLDYFDPNIGLGRRMQQQKYLIYRQRPDRMDGISIPHNGDMVGQKWYHPLRRQAQWISPLRKRV
jgi:hypothetical protein